MRIVCGPPAGFWFSSGVAAVLLGAFTCNGMSQLPVSPPTIVDTSQPTAGSVATGPLVVPKIGDSDGARFRTNSAANAGEFAEPVSRVQGGLPSSLILPPPTMAARSLEKRFVRAEIDPQLPLALAVGRPKILQFNESPARIFLPNDDVVTAEIVDQNSGREIAVTGLKPGSTTLTLWFNDKSSPDGKSIVSYLVQVYADPLLTRPIGNLQDEINATFPNCNVALTELGGRLVVKGQAQDAVQVVQILQILAGARGVTGGLTRPANPPTVGTALNFTDNNPLQQEEEAALRRETVDPVALARAGIVNLLRIPGEQQVMLRVTVAEVNRNAARSIGLDFSARIGNNTILSRSAGLSNGAGNSGSNSSGQLDSGRNAGNIFASLDSGQVALQVEALRSMGFSRTLAEPNLVTINGMPANFQAGGQFPVPVVSPGGAGQNLQGVSFVPFGIQLRFVPLIQDRDVIRLQLQAEVSARNNAGGATVNNTIIPGIESKTVSTNVELRSGQTLAVAGIIKTSFSAGSSRIPFWGDLPIIGPFGGINRTSADEQELVILVTPELVAPIDACEAPSLPGSDTFEPTDIEFFVKNRLESRRTKDFRSSVRTDYAKQRVPDKCCPDKYLVGPIGPTDRCCNKLGTVPHKAMTTLQSLPTNQPAPIVGRTGDGKVVR